MKKNKNVSLVITLLFFTHATASSKPAQSMSSPADSVAVALIATLITSLVGTIQVIRGSNKFFTSSDDSLTSKTLLDYKKKELLSMPKEKLARIIAREDERSKNSMESFEIFLNGIVWLSVAGIGINYSFNCLQDFEVQRAKPASVAPLAPTA